MARPRKNPAITPAEDTKKPKMKKARTAEGRENQMIALAMDMAWEQLENRTASSQVLTHFLQLGTEKARLERERIKTDVKLNKAKIKAYKASVETGKVYQEAVDAMMRYTRKSEDEDVQ